MEQTSGRKRKIVTENIRFKVILANVWLYLGIVFVAVFTWIFFMLFNEKYAWMNKWWKRSFPNFGVRWLEDEENISTSALKKS